MVDPREQIRQFLEQRRELGESEFVLDTMAVDEVLRMLGARPSSVPDAARGTPGPAPRAVPRAAPERPAGPDQVPEVQRDRRAADASDWRSALRAAGAGPVPEPGAAEPRVSAGRVPTHPPDGPPPPDMRQPKSPPPVPAPSAKVSEPVATTGESQPALVPLDQVPTGLVVGSPAHDMFGGRSEAYQSLDELARAVAACTRCSLHATAKNPVPGVGNPRADFVCVGEAPGAHAAEQGVPFIGPAGQLLTKILGAINLSREDVFICNVLKHRPPGNRNPTPDEIVACSPFLIRQLELLRPKVLLALGTFAAQTLLQTKEPIGKLRGKIHRYYGVPLVVTYHPAALLRNPSWKRPTWEDVQLARRLLDRAAPGE